MCKSLQNRGLPNRAKKPYSRGQIDPRSPSIACGDSDELDVTDIFTHVMEKQVNGEIHPARRSVVRALSFVEDIVYVGLGVILAIAALALLIATLKTLGYSLWTQSLTGQITSVLDQILLVLLIIELLYTVQVSFREHALLVEPFLVVALIAVIRRILVITAELTKLPESGQAVFQRAMFELGLLSLMILILVSSLILLQRQKKAASSK